MKTGNIALVALCAALAACGSKTPEPPAATTAENQATMAPAPLPTAAVAMKPAPEGLPSRIAREVLTAGNQKCDNVTKADRNAQDGTITASCASGESYRIYTVEGQGAVAAPL